MRKSILMASFLLATLYACNQEEEALKTLRPTDGGEVMTTASGTLTPAELLAQDSLMMAYFNVMYPHLLHAEESTLYGDSTFLANAQAAKDNVYNNYGGFAGMSAGDIDQLFSDAFKIIIGTTPWPYDPPINTPDGSFRKCWRDAEADIDVRGSKCACCQTNGWKKRKCKGNGEGSVDKDKCGAGSQ